MFVKHLKLSNFRSIEDREFEFSKCNVIFGAPGTGKSSVIQAIAYALFDYLPEERIIDYVQDGKKSFNISLEALHKNDVIKLDVKAGDKGTKKELIYKNEEFYNSNVTEKLSEVYNASLALYSSISMQDQTSSVLFEQPAERLEKLKSLLGMDNIAEASERMQEDLSRLKSEISILKTEISTMDSRKFDLMDLPEIPEEDLSLKSEYSVLSLKFENFKRDYSEYEKLVKEENLRKSHYDKQVVEFANLQKNISRVEKEIENSNNKLFDLKAKKKPLIDLDNIDKSLSKLRSDYQTLEKKLKFARLGKCSECGEVFKGNVSNLEVELESLKQDGIKLKFDKDTAESSNKEAEKIEILYDTELLNLKKLEKEKETLKNSNLVDPGEFQFLDLKAPEFDSDKFETVKRRIALNELKKSEYDRVVSFNEKQREREKLNLEEIKGKKDKLAELSGNFSILEEGRNTFDKEFTPDLLEGGLSFIEKEMNNFFSRVHSKYKVFMKRDKKSIKFFYSKRPEHLAPIGTLSGHERKIMSVAFRVALTAVQDFGIMVMDEVDGSADDDRSLALYKNIMELDYEQIFIISHRPLTVRYLVNECGAKLFTMDGVQ